MNEQETGDERTNDSEEKKNPLDSLNLSDEEFRLEYHVCYIRNCNQEGIELRTPADAEVSTPIEPFKMDSVSYKRIFKEVILLFCQSISLECLLLN